MRTFIDKVRPWIGPILMVALFLVLVPAAAHADVINDAESTIKRIIKVAGWIMVVAGVIVGIKSGLQVSEGRGGWAGIGVAVLLLVLGFKIGTQGSDTVGGLFGV